MPAITVGASSDVLHRKGRFSLRTAVALLSRSHSSTVSGLVIATVVLIAPLKVSQTRPDWPVPRRVTITVLGSPSGVGPGNAAWKVSTDVLPLTEHPGHPLSIAP